MGTTTAPSPRFATRVNESAPGRGWAWPLTILLHALLAAAVVIAPILAHEPLPAGNDRATSAFFVSPSYVAPPPPPPPPAASRPAAATRVEPKDASRAFTAPVDVPQDLPAEAWLDLGIEGGVPGGVEGGVPVSVVLTVTVNFVLRDAPR